MQTITIQHVDGSNPAQFQVVTAGKTLGPFGVPSPADYPIENLPIGNLMKELRWYLEKFLDYPYPPETDRAERVLESLRTWGLAIGEALFESRETGRLLDRATDNGYADLELRVSSDDPSILHWPWEAVRTTDGGVLSRTCQIKRHLNELRPPRKLSDQLPQDRVNILLVTARPMEADVSYRSISRPLVDLVDELNLPAKITVLRPPTLTQLRDHLRENKNHYHILHFDGHGSYGGPPAHDSRRAFELKGVHGQLIFEDHNGKPDAHDAEKLSELLKEYNVPVVVLNACQSAMVDERAKDAFASVAAALQWSGVRSVVAMAYSLYVSGAQQFLPEFYKRLFEDGSVSDAARAGRQKMLERQERICSRGEFKLEDWLVPVVYEQETVDFSFAKTTQVDQNKVAERVPQEAQDTENPYGFVGRDNAILELERAMRRKPAGILVHGLGGVGKTTVAQGFVRWLAKTEGLENGCFWQTFQDVRSAEYVINQMIGAIFGADALAASIDVKLPSLVKALKKNRFLIVWDNFEVVSGIEAASLQPTLPKEDRTLLHQFLKDLRGGPTKVLITSRSQEDWLEPAHCQRIGIGGLVGEERWEYCEKIVSDFGLGIDRGDKEWKSLIDLLDGHPLAMRVILPRLANGQTPTQLINGIKQNIGQFKRDDADSAKLFDTMGFAQNSLPEELRPLLIPLSLHERFVVADLLEDMAQSASPKLGETEIARFLSSLSMAGLLRKVQTGIFEIHPTLTRFLEVSTEEAFPEPSQTVWTRAFVEHMGKVADQHAAKPLQEKRGVFNLLGACFARARELCIGLNLERYYADLTRFLAQHASDTRNWAHAIRLFQDLAQHGRDHGNLESEARAYHYLGVISHGRREFENAEKWYLKSLEISEKHDMGYGMATTFHQLGFLALERHELEEAEKWHLKSLEVNETMGDQHGAATDYHHLGIIAQEQSDFDNAEHWYRRALEIAEGHGDEHGVAATCHHLGVVAQERGKFDDAEKWYLKSLSNSQSRSDDHGMAIGYHGLGVIAWKRKQYDNAETWFLKSLEIKEKQGDIHGASISYHHLGIIAQLRSDFEHAEKWYFRALEIEKNQGNEHGAALTFHQLGRIAQERRDFELAGNNFTEAMRLIRRLDSSNEKAKLTRNYRRLYDQAPPDQRDALLKQWNDNGFGEFPLGESEEENE